VVPGRKPHLYAVVNGTGKLQRIAGEKAAKQQSESADSKQRLTARDGIQHKEHAGDHQCRTEVFLQEEEHQRQRDSGEHRQNVLVMWDLYVALDVRQLRTALLQDTKEFPPVREVPGEKEGNQKLDRFDGLEAEQVHLRIALTRSSAERHERNRK